jgi:hypothetical protein
MIPKLSCHALQSYSGQMGQVENIDRNSGCDQLSYCAANTLNTNSTEAPNTRRSLM